MLAIKNNLMATGASRELGKSYNALSKSVARLSSGLRINTAGDDAAGLAVRELIRADVAQLRQGSRNARDGISMLQVAEGATGVIDDILIRMKELAEQASTDSYSTDQRAIMDAEFSQLVDEINRIANNTTFNGLNLLDADGKTFSIHLGSTEMIDIASANVSAVGLGVGGTKSTAVFDTWVKDAAADVVATAGADGNLTLSFAGQDNVVVAVTNAQTFTLNQLRDAVNAQSRAAASYDAAEVVYETSTGMYGLKVSAKSGGAANDLTVTGVAGLNQDNFTVTQGTGTAISIADSASARTALDTLDGAIKTKDEFRAKLGYLMNRLEAAISVIDVQAENLMAAESRISDVDVAHEMSVMTRNQVLAQAGISMLSQANSMPQMALSLLQ